MWGPCLIAQLVNKSPISLWYMIVYGVYISIHGVNIYIYIHIIQHVCCNFVAMFVALLCPIYSN